MKYKRKGQVYLIRADNNLYKIGRSKQAKGRFETMQRACACTMELLWVMDAESMSALEDALHRLFAKVRHHGEWFALSESNVRFILALDGKTVKALLAAREQVRARKAEERVKEIGEREEERPPPWGSHLVSAGWGVHPSDD